MEEYSVTEPSGLPHEQRDPSKEDTLSFEGQPEQISVPRVINERRLKKGIRKIFEALIQEDVELPTTVVVPEVKPKKPKIIRSTPKELLERKPITITPVIIKSQKVEEETRSLDFTICELCHKRIDDIKVTSHCPLKHRHDFHTNCWNTILIDNIVLCLTNINDNPHYCSHYNNISLTIPEVIHEEKEEFPELSVVVPKEKKNEVKKPTVWQPSWRTTTGDVSTYEGEHKPKKKKGRKPDKKVYVDITDYKQPKISEEADKAWNEIFEDTRIKDQMKLLIRALIERTDECDTLKHKNEELQSNLLEVSDLLAKQSEKYEILKDQNEALKHETKTLESNLEQVRGSLFIAVQQYESLRYEFESLRMPTVYKCTICNYYPANYRNNPCNHLCFCTNCKNAYPNDTKMCRVCYGTVM